MIHMCLFQLISIWGSCPLESQGSTGCTEHVEKVEGHMWPANRRMSATGCMKQSMQSYKVTFAS